MTKAIEAIEVIEAAAAAADKRHNEALLAEIGTRASNLHTHLVDAMAAGDVLTCRLIVRELVALGFRYPKSAL